MDEMHSAFGTAIGMILSMDPALIEIVTLSARVTLSAVALAALIGLPLGALLATRRFPGRGFVVVGFNALMGLPPVAVGLFAYIALSRSGPLGELGLLFTPTAMIIAQCILVTPIIVALGRQVIEEYWEEYREQLRSFGVSPTRAVPTLLWDARYALVTALLAGLGRALAEVGAVIIVGGNIDHVTRVMTTAIALETSKGKLELALGLGLILLMLALLINGSVHFVQYVGQRHYG